MDSFELERRVQHIVEAVGFRLLSANWTPRSGRQLLRVVADAEDHNITVNECAQLSRAISDLLDSYPHEFPDYRLEVSSPGLGRPLEKWQFAKNLGREVEVHFLESGVKKVCRGELLKANEDEISIRDNQAIHPFEFDMIKGVYVIPKL